jgi:hypothetical protein
MSDINISYSMKILMELVEKIHEAGFDDSRIADLVRKLPSRGYGAFQEKFLRQLYYAYLGAGEFTLKPTVVRMFLDDFYVRERHGSLFAGDYLVHVDDERYFPLSIDLINLGILPPLRKKEKNLSTYDAINRFSAISERVEFASFLAWSMDREASRISSGKMGGSASREKWKNHVPQS